MLCGKSQEAREKGGIGVRSEGWGRIISLSDDGAKRLEWMQENIRERAMVVFRSKSCKRGSLMMGERRKACARALCLCCPLH